MNTEQLVSGSIQRYREALRRSLGLPSLDFERIDRSNGLSGTVRFQFSLETDTPPSLDSLSGQFKGHLLSDGLPRGTAQVTEPRKYPLSSWTFRARNRSLLVSVEDRIRMRFDGAGLLAGVPFSPGLSEMPERSVLDRTEWRWQDRPVHAVELEADTGSKFLYISREQPHRPLGVTAGYNPGWSRRISYDSNLISTIKTYSDERLVRRFETTDGEETRLLLARGGSHQSGRTMFSLRPSGDGLDVRVGTRGRGEESFSDLGGGIISFENGRPSAFSAEFVRESSDRQLRIRLRLNADGLEPVEDPSTFDVNDTMTYETGSVSELLAEVFPQPDTTPDEAGKNDEKVSAGTQNTPETEVTSSTRPDGSKQKKPKTTQSPRRSKDSQDRKTKVRYPENSGETVMRRIGTNFKISEPPPDFQPARDLYRRGEIDKARERLQDLVDTYPRSINVHYTLGLIHYNSGRTKAARTYFRTVHSLGFDSQLVEWSRAYLKQLDSAGSGSE